MTRTFFAAALLLAGVLSAAHASDAAPGIPVAYSDLDLNSAAGQSTLKARLADAAAKLCTPAFAGQDQGGSDQSARENMVVYRACIGRLSQRAMAQIAQPRN
jgi:UrcA family protein